MLPTYAESRPTAQNAGAFRNAQTMPEPWVSADEVASHLGVVKDSVYQWVETKGLPTHRVDRLWTLRLSEIDEWVHAGGANEDGDRMESK